MQKKGFTLVELLVVISVIALLLGILTPALVSARRVAYKTACKQNLHGCAVAFRMYLDDNRNYFPQITNMPTIAGNGKDDPNSIYQVMKNYISGQEALKCPADRYIAENTTYFKSEGSSYEYNFHLAGKRLQDDWFAKRFGTNEVHILKDYGNFHNKSGKGARMYLYADTLVADRKRNK